MEQQQQQVTYEATTPSGALILIDAITDDQKRTAGQLTNILKRFGGELNSAESIGWMFDRRGLIAIEDTEVNEEKFTEQAVSLGAEEVKKQDGYYEVQTAPTVLEQVKTGLEKSAYKILISECTAVPKSRLQLSSEQEQMMLDLMKALDDHEDVKNVFTNFDIGPLVTNETEKLSA